MKFVNHRMIVIALLMFAGAGLALAMKPTQKLADAREKPDLNAMFPKQFGDWKMDPLAVLLLVNPEVQENLDKTYNQTVSRTYVNHRGERVMLSVAYGGDQSRTLQLHKPETCYVAQGFQIGSSIRDVLQTSFTGIRITRLIASQGTRVEPITYWMRVGDKTVHSGIGQMVARLLYGLTGKLPDGVLVRVSTIKRDSPQDYGIHEEFITDLLASMSARDREFFVGGGLAKN